MIARTAYDALPEDLTAELRGSGLDPEAVHAIVAAALEEDLPGGGDDVTSASTIPEEARGTADFAAREPGTVAGLAVAAVVFAYVLGDDVEITDRAADGTRVGAGDTLMRVTGPLRGLLTAERTALNFACHLSGIGRTDVP